MTCLKFVCEVCELEKQSKQTFPENKAWVSVQMQAMKRLELIHTDALSYAYLFFKRKQGGDIC